ncbi:MAG TPA: hypothetical protein VL359_05315 [bacterium]|nr:hypothetical protein [bacterium]
MSTQGLRGAHARGRPPWLPPLLLGALALAGAAWPVRALAQSQDLLNTVSNTKLQAFEERITQRLSNELARYVSRNQFVLSVKVIWNPDVLPATQGPAESPDKEKLPGFPIFVRAPNAPEADKSTPPYTRLTVRVLLDETLPEYYERFVRKLIPIVAGFDAARGDQVVVVKETFPFLNKNEQPPTLPEGELMKNLGPAPAGAAPPGGAPAPAPEPGGVSPREAAQNLFDEGRYQDALRAVQDGFQRATSNPERAQYLSMEGSILYTMNNPDAARLSWQRALTFDPADLEVHRMLDYLNSAAPKGGS